VTVVDSPGSGGCEYRIVLNDGSEEFLDPRTLTIDRDNVMYGLVKDAGERARFLRSAYYQICDRVEYSEREDRYLLPWKGFHITIQGGGQPAGSEA